MFSNTVNLLTTNNNKIYMCMRIVINSDFQSFRFIIWGILFEHIQIGDLSLVISICFSKCQYKILSPERVGFWLILSDRQSCS